MNHLVPFMKASNVVAPKVQVKEAPDLEEAIEEEDDGQVAEAPQADDDEIDLKKDKYIKQPKAKKPAKKAAKATAAADEVEDEDIKPKGRGKAKGAAAKAKGKK